MTEFEPIFLVSSERCGSNLVLKMLDAHPELCGPSPSHLIRTLVLNLPALGGTENSQRRFERTIDAVARVQEAALGRWTVEADAFRAPSLYDGRSLGDIVATVFGTEAKANGKQRPVIKETRFDLVAPFVLSHFPRAKFVFLVRDPRDMALSWKNSANHPGDVRTAARVWIRDQEAYRRLRQSLPSRIAQAFLRYEDLISDPESTLSGVCEALGLRYSTSMLHYNENTKTQENARRLANWTNLEKPLLSDNSGKYGRHLSATEIAFVETICGPEMVLAGYDSTGIDGTLSDVEKELEIALGPEITKIDTERFSSEEREVRRARGETILYLKSLNPKV